MNGEISLSPSEFYRGYRAYQEQVPRDPWYDSALLLLEQFWGQPRVMADAIAVLLGNWHQGFYRYGMFDVARLEKALETHLPTIRSLRRRAIQSFGTDDKPTIKHLFLAFLDALKRAGGKRPGAKSSVAVTKTLHLLAPDFFPPWDSNIAAAYGCCLTVSPEEDYLAFLRSIQALARQLEGHVPPNCDRTLLKLIDEYNYAKYTGHWL